MEVNVNSRWYGAKTLYLHKDFTEQEGESQYEERVVLLHAESEDHAISLAEEEARTYVEGLDAEYLGFVSIYHTFLEIPKSGAEVFSIMRSIDMEVESFIDHFYDDDSFGTRKWKSGPV